MSACRQRYYRDCYGSSARFPSGLQWMLLRNPCAKKATEPDSEPVYGQKLSSERFFVPLFNLVIYIVPIVPKYVKACSNSGAALERMASRRTWLIGSPDGNSSI